MNINIYSCLGFLFISSPFLIMFLIIYKQYGFRKAISFLIGVVLFFALIYIGIYFFWKSNHSNQIKEIIAWNHNY